MAHQIVWSATLQRDVSLRTSFRRGKSNSVSAWRSETGAVPAEKRTAPKGRSANDDRPNLSQALSGAGLQKLSRDRRRAGVRPKGVAGILLFGTPNSIRKPAKSVPCRLRPQQRHDSG